MTFNEKIKERQKELDAQIKKAKELSVRLTYERDELDHQCMLAFAHHHALVTTSEKERWGRQGWSPERIEERLMVHFRDFTKRRWDKGEE